MAGKGSTSLSDQIREAIEASDESRYRISKETGIDAASLCRFVRGQVGQSLDSLDRLAESISLRVVMDDTEAKPRQRKGR